MSEAVPSSASGHYFLSYSRSDERFALRLARDLRERGVAMWVDQLDIRPSEHWDRAIERAVRDCAGLVVVVSPRSVASENVMDEISFAIDNKKRVVPVMVEACALPLRLTRTQLIDATANYDRALEQCRAALADHGGPGPAAPAPVAAPASLDEATLAEAKARVAALLGPIAPMLVDKAARRATSRDELYRLLSLHIENEKDRASFLTGLPDSPGPTASPGPAKKASLSPEILESMSDTLVRYVGPVAPLLVQRHARSCASAEDLAARLADHVPEGPERTEFRTALARLAY